jgi:hypothetical protein
MIDLKFLESVEGNLSYGYVPTRNGVPIGNSGVTIGIGIDLGQHSNFEAKNDWRLPPEMILKFMPYFSVCREKAQKILADFPLKLSDSEVETLNSCVVGAFERTLRARYNLASKVKYDDIPLSARTVLFSIQWQFGGFSTHKELWRAAIVQDWVCVIKALRKDTEYTTRRKLEADYLARDLVVIV